MRRVEKQPETIVHKDHSVIIPPATLRERAMIIGGPGASRDGFDADLLERAEKALAQLESDFTAWMADEADKLEQARETFKTTPNDEDTQQAFYRAAHDIRGQGRTYGYPLAGQIADGLCDLLEGAENLDRPSVVDLVDAHVDAIRAIIRDDVRSEDNDLARSLIAELRTAREAIIGTDRFVKITSEIY